MCSSNLQRATGRVSSPAWGGRGICCEEAESSLLIGEGRDIETKTSMRRRQRTAKNWLWFKLNQFCGPGSIYGESALPVTCCPPYLNTAGTSCSRAFTRLLSSIRNSGVGRQWPLASPTVQVSTKQPFYRLVQAVTRIERLDAFTVEERASS